MNNTRPGKEELIDTYNLVAHPEGGYYREVYRSGPFVPSPVHGHERNCVTHIYFLLCKAEISRFHRVLHDEIWNFYDGAPIRLIQFDLQNVTQETIGPGCDGYCSIVKGQCYQAAESTGEYSLVGCSVAPGFDFADFSFLKNNKTDLEQFAPFHKDFGKFL